MTGSPPDIRIQEVAPRDGLQNEMKWVDTAEKIRLINSLSAIGFERIEVSSFVSAKAVPALRDAAEVFAGIDRRPSTIYTALVPNRRGAERALAALADELNFVMSASETHNRANINMTHAQSFEALSEVVRSAHAVGKLVNATVATAFGCPFEGMQPFEKVCRIVKQYFDHGVGGVTLADTTGMANPRQVSQLLSKVLLLVPADKLTIHFHNTRGLGLVNVLAAYATGARRFDAALGGLGGCPFAPGATGNVCTEDLVNLCHETGLRTGLDLQRLIDLSLRLPVLIGHGVPGQVAKAGRPLDLHPLPERLRAVS
ncbi:hydroxymethylglutaryl-CoA lyase [Bradyrhizobium sacchari]|uniref:Hydroxymethylglutaryl-CoA lyase n=1 Tax=Bradyrhizobium sacchari TaxID=1399419 RepID=A0A560JNY0_9BRAD|nr:hydroxymethylglutaryl-CoA lyase [Bradyrhizobium sacchari]OPY97004.1 hydroxymethylglutaryl-CoA lyase [Bradyrhizobium sacchari]TWB58748.1 hydroxymethylglutaryl-CoA lyase [Bradyrhizobium sacchari]TWB72892.1 hydroxymethylglutaryl-CoA lyase [Bradyrhizobium sacchari]